MHSYIMRNNSPSDLISIIDNALMFIIIRSLAWIQQKYLELRFVTIFEVHPWIFFLVFQKHFGFYYTRKVDMLKKIIYIVHS